MLTYINLGNTIEKRDFKIILLDENGKQIMTWKINKAFLVGFEAVERQEDENRFTIKK